MEKKSKMPQIGEAVFSIVYLIFGFCAGIFMLASAKDRTVILLFGILTLVLAGGDSFHLIPRIINALKEKFERYDFFAGLGLMISSVTMTVFYIILYGVWKNLYPELKVSSFWFDLLLGFAIVRIVLCLLPQNNWFKKEGNPSLGIVRNVPFVAVGLIVIYLFLVAGNLPMVMAIVISFSCYLPVVLFAKSKPMIGMLMIPKTMAYMWMICMGLALL